MVAPVGAPSMPEAVRAGAEVYSALRRELSGRKLSTGLGDEGGFAPEVAEPEEVLRLLVQAISDAGYKPGAEGVSIALDPASSEFRQPDGHYLLSSSDMIERYAAITGHFPVHLIEDGLGEDDDEGWIALTARLGATTELVGDDIFCTNPAIITGAIERGIGNSALIKLNQIGTVTETLQAMALSAAWRATGSSSRTGPGKPRTTSSPTWPSAPAAVISRPAPRPAANAWPSTTGCLRSPPARRLSVTACP